MQFKLSSCFATPSESVAIAVVLVDCPNLDRPPAIIPPLHPSSLNLAAPFSSHRPFPHPQYLLSLPISLQYIYSAAKSLQ